MSRRKRHPCEKVKYTSKAAAWAAADAQRRSKRGRVLEAYACPHKSCRGYWHLRTPVTFKRPRRKW